MFISSFTALSLSQSACEGQEMELLCSAGESLVIQSLFWGRVSESECPHDEIANYTCVSQDDSVLEDIRQVGSMKDNHLLKCFKSSLCILHTIH